MLTPTLTNDAANTRQLQLRTNALDALMALGADYVTAALAIARIERTCANEQTSCERR